MNLSLIIWICGLLFIIKILINLIDIIYAFYIYKLSKWTRGPSAFIKISEPHRYALITGGANGIGREYSLQLAKLGFNIIIIDKDMEQMQFTKELIRQRSDRKVKLIQIDFNQSDNQQSIYQLIINETADLEVAVIINNVGIMLKDMTVFENMPTEIIESFVKINVLPTLTICHIFLPKMLKYKYRPIIINVASMAAITLMPYHSLYGATKSFLKHFSTSLCEEHRDDNVEIHCVLPGLVSTNMTEMEPSAVMVATAEEIVEQTMLTVGHLTESFGCFSHYLQSRIIQSLPKSLLRMRMKFLRRYHLEKKS